MPASVDTNKYLIDKNKEDFDNKMGKLRETIDSIFDNLIENVDHIFHQYQISSQDNGVEDYGLSEITKSTPKNNPSKSNP